jgi:hypothetical protein
MENMSVPAFINPGYLDLTKIEQHPSTVKYNEEKQINPRTHFR